MLPQTVSVSLKVHCHTFVLLEAILYFCF